MPCSLCSEERCDCISSVLDAIEPAAPPVPASSGRASTSAVAPRPEPHPLSVWPPPPPPPPAPPWGGCLLADAAFDAPPERLSLELANAAGAMFAVAEVDGRYRPAGDALVWLRDHTANGQFTVSEAEAGPYLAALDQACADHLANTPTTAGSF